VANEPDAADSNDDRGVRAADAGGSLATVAAGLLDGETHLTPPAPPPDTGPGEVLSAGEPLSLRAATSAEGRATLIVSGGAWLLAVAELVMLALLGPELIGEFDLGDHAAVYVLVAPALLFVLAQPIANLVDRPGTNRPRVLGVLLAVAAVALAVAGLTSDRWVFLGAGVLSGFGLLAGQPAFLGLLGDRYPLRARSMVLGTYSAFGAAAYLVAPLVVLVLGGDGDRSWRAPFLLASAATLVLAVCSLRLPDARRGRFEVETLFGAGDALVVEPTTSAHALARLGQIRTLRLVTLAVAALGFALLTWGVFLNQYVDERFEVSTADRAVVLALAAIPGLLALPVTVRWVAARGEEPGRIVVLAGGSLLAFNAAAVGLWAPTFGLLMVGQAVGLAGVFTAVGALIVVVPAVSPPQLRSQAGAVFLSSLFVGATTAALLLVDLSATYGLRTTIAVAVPLVTVVGFGMLRAAARSVVPDMARVVSDLREERSVVDARRAGIPVPALQVVGVDFSYGPVQVLFDVDLEIADGETVALLGTNGAGKSTLLRVISGLELPSRGVVRHDGHTITFADPPTRVARGIVQLSGGRSTFPPLSVTENLRLGAYLCDRSEVDQRVAEVLDLFPTLRDRGGQAAGTLSGGQQQLLGLAKALVPKPRLLIIDELSLGLSPAIVGELLGLVRQLKDRGTTMLIVEQSANIALSLADRAVFMEKGEVRFEGPAADLLERDDLLRAVFLGGEDG